MSLKNKAFLFYAKPLIKEIDTIKENPIPSQKECFNYLISNGVDTFFGKQHKIGRAHV